MRRRDFEAMVREMADGLPADFRAGVASIEVTGKTVPHPSRPGIFTLGECVPHSFGAPGESDAELRSTVLLHYGSFAALAAGEPGFDWREEAWETLTHEVRHHLEWRADVRALEAFDDAVEANYRRHDGEPFEPLFFLAGERVEPGVTKVEDDVFVDVPLSRRAWRRAAGGSLPVGWHGRSYRVLLPSILPDVLFVTVEGLQPQPAGDLVAVVRRKPGLRDLFRRPAVGSVALRASSVAG
jgi:hypothetical protein